MPILKGLPYRPRAVKSLPIGVPSLDTRAARVTGLLGKASSLARLRVQSVDDNLKITMFHFGVLEYAVDVLSKACRSLPCSSA